MKKLINAIAQAVVERILSEEQVDQFIDRIVELLIQRLPAAGAPTSGGQTPPWRRWY